MKFGISLSAVNPRGWVAVAEQADRLGFESVWVPEHLVIPAVLKSSPHEGATHPPVPPSVPVFDAFAMLSHLAARTEHIRLGTSVYNIGLRHPFVSARGAATVDVLSRGRLEFGIGASWLREEWQAVGLDFDTRGALVDEAIEVCQRLWQDDTVEHHGRFFDFAAVAFEPKPVQPGGPALQIGGDGPAAMRRAATVGAGWMPMNHSLADLPGAVATVQQLAVDKGRSAPLQITTHAPDHIVKPTDVEAYAEAGVTRLIVTPWESSSKAIEGITRFADQHLS